jgi:hypothetical protein
VIYHNREGDFDDSTFGGEKRPVQQAFTGQSGCSRNYAGSISVGGGVTSDSAQFGGIPSALPAICRAQRPEAVSVVRDLVKLVMTQISTCHVFDKRDVTIAYAHAIPVIHDSSIATLDTSLMSLL